MSCLFTTTLKKIPAVTEQLPVGLAKYQTNNQLTGQTASLVYESLTNDRYVFSNRLLNTYLTRLLFGGNLLNAGEETAALAAALSPKNEAIVPDLAKIVAIFGRPRDLVLLQQIATNKRAHKQAHCFAFWGLFYANTPTHFAEWCRSLLGDPKLSTDFQKLCLDLLAQKHEQNPEETACRQLLFDWALQHDDYNHLAITTIINHNFPLTAAEYSSLNQNPTASLLNNFGLLSLIEPLAARAAAFQNWQETFPFLLKSLNVVDLACLRVPGCLNHLNEEQWQHLIFDYQLSPEEEDFVAKELQQPALAAQKAALVQFFSRSLATALLETDFYQIEYESFAFFAKLLEEKDIQNFQKNAQQPRLNPYLQLCLAHYYQQNQQTDAAVNCLKVFLKTLNYQERTETLNGRFLRHLSKNLTPLQKELAIVLEQDPQLFQKSNYAFAVINCSFPQSWENREQYWSYFKQPGNNETLLFLAKQEKTLLGWQKLSEFWLNMNRCHFIGDLKQVLSAEQQEILLETARAVQQKRPTAFQENSFLRSVFYQLGNQTDFKVVGQEHYYLPDYLKGRLRLYQAKLNAPNQ